jgi:tetratricopeptide (TPR) repeat protein
LLQWQTFLSGGRFETESAYATVPALALAALFFAIALGYLQRIARGASARRSALPLCYFAMQAVCAAAAAYQTRLYLVALAMHYTEYHVIMAPRCFYAARDRAPSSASLATRLRQRPLLFYAVLLLVVVLFEMRSQVSHDVPATTAFFVHLFDGIFFVHYFVEAFLWKLGNPFYRQTLAPLYFEPWPPSKQTRQRPEWRLPGPGAWAAATAAIALCAYSQDRIGETAHAFARRVIDPMHAEHHLRWGVELARAGDLQAARKHFREAVHRNPDDDQAQSALRWVDQKLVDMPLQP